MNSPSSPHHLSDDDLATPMDTNLPASYLPETGRSIETNSMICESNDIPHTASSGERAKIREPEIPSVRPKGHPTESPGQALTLEPYTPHSTNRANADRRRRVNIRRRGSVALGTTDQPLTRPVPKDFKKFYVIKAHDNSNLARIDVIRANREIRDQLGDKPYNISETRTGTLILELRNELQIRAAENIQSLAGIPVSVSEHTRLNERKGTIWYENHFDYSDAQLLEELSRSGVKSVYRTQKKTERGPIPSFIYILTFNSDLPEKVTIGWTRCSVRAYIPKPRRCFKCQAFGHGANSCRHQIGICTNCAEPVHELPCYRPSLCSNCGDAHPASANSCRAYKMEEEILATQAKENITYGEARKIVRERSIRPSTTFARITQTQNRITQSQDFQANVLEKQTRKTTSCDGATQTDDTVPSSTVPAPLSSAQPQPSMIVKTSTCKPQPNTVVVTLPSRKRQQSSTFTSAHGSPKKPNISRKPSLKVDAQPTTHHNISGVSGRRPSTGEHKKPEDRRQLLRDHPVPQDAPTFLPPSISTRPWDQRNVNKDLRRSTHTTSTEHKS